MDYEDLQAWWQSQGNMLGNPGQEQLSPGLLGEWQGKNQANIQNMQNIAQQGIQQGMAANQNFQAGQQAQMNATENQLRQKMAQDEAKRQQMMGLALTVATGGFGGAGAGAAGAEAGVSGATAAGIANALAGSNLDPNKKFFF